ncbi:MAG: hypothetical protein COU42_00730 [Candidatus Nealsonbacteria bacterium CG10_big_fil_rev_8_21_14_0_10_36_24]|uniref:Uncharacterized protein n=1 Tax=Candidatus Nealsonbacteria bacterium CG10_big_fil_rev_8_21_14_0_10_36_24 TaxID=1974710 RepID=A0A2M6NSH9_9BACT|nr:MAG: hypothetical protein COU42_00730 [Candidatus Nealsonbacteria bacterium CG10_big_fil_rev_8_21_14_0_10_36_24]
MEEDFLQAIERITKKEIVELIPEEIDFLKARKSYLTSEQLKKFQEVLGEVKKEKKTISKKSK